MTTIRLDFDLLPSLEVGSVAANLNPAVAEALQALPATYDRAMGALHFAARISNVEPREDGSDVKLREAFLRASIGEFVSMDQAVHCDRPGQDNPRIHQSANPLLHFMKELRNMQFHFLTSPLTVAKKRVVWADHEFDMAVWTVEPIALADFRRLRNADRYAPADQESMVRWFNEAQAEWGVNELIILAVREYASEILV